MKMSRITITIPNELVDELMKVAQAKSKTEAIKNAIKNEIKQKKKEKIKNLAGKVDFNIEANDLRHGDKRLG
jgi:metal-responsive CopG/Arc/MetJ family transcriptional regulator